MHPPWYLIVPYLAKVMRYFCSFIYRWYNLGQSRLWKKLPCLKSLQESQSHNESAQMCFSSGHVGHFLQCIDTYDIFGHDLLETCWSKIWNSLQQWQVLLLWVVIHCMLVSNPEGRLSLHSLLNSNQVMRQNLKGASTMCPLEYPLHMTCHPSGLKWGHALLSKGCGDIHCFY